MNRPRWVRRAAADYVARHGDNAVEVIRGLCVEAHRRGDRLGFRLWRDVGIAADEMLMEQAAAIFRA
jgi:hypothetical protein